MAIRGRGVVVSRVRGVEPRQFVGRRVERLRRLELDARRPHVGLRRRKPALLRRRRHRGTLARMESLTVGAVAGVALEFFADPQLGRRRRHTAGDRTRGFVRRAGRRASRTTHFVVSLGRGQARRLGRRPRPGGVIDDVTLADKVRSEVLGHSSAPKGRVNVQAYGGVVELRGELDRPDLIRELVGRVRGVQGVRAVENLLHVPGTPAPTHLGGALHTGGKPSPVRATRV